MNVLIDTSIWSLALRRRASSSKNVEVDELNQLIEESRAKIIGPIRQEILSGISDPKLFKILKDKLRAFPDIPLETSHHELAAEFFNQCRNKGIQGSHIDFLICAAAKIASIPIFTSDRDFTSYSKIIHVQLHHPTPRLK